jgi:monofunctional biosynthetic peptidoglycan transglycosylase
MKKIGWFAGHILLFFFIFSWEIVLLHRWINPVLTPLMGIRIVQGGLKGEWVGAKRDWISFEEMPTSIKTQIIASEDATFYQHHGFDFDGIRKAIEYNKKNKGKRMRGGSTISQQTAKNIFLWPSRDWIRKGMETYFTVLIETAWSKERILEVYLNNIEFGKGIYGVEAAAQFYYKKSANKLTSHQTAALVAVVPAPLRRNPLYPSKRMRTKIQQLKSQ